MSKLGTANRGWVSDTETQIKAWQLLNKVIDTLHPPSEFTRYGFTVHVDVRQELLNYLSGVNPDDLRGLLLSIKSELVDYDG